MNHASPQLLATPMFRARERTQERADLLDRMCDAQAAVRRFLEEDGRLRAAGRQDERWALYRASGDAAMRRADALAAQFENRGWRLTRAEEAYVDPARPRRNFNPGAPDAEGGGA